MDDSCQDFVDVCSKLLKRVRKKEGEPRQRGKEEKQPPSLAGDGAKRRRNHKKDGNSVAQPVGATAEAVQKVGGGGPGLESEDAGRTEGGLTAKDKALQRMQEFKRARPQKIVHTDNNHTLDIACAPPPTLMHRKVPASPPESFSTNLHLEPTDSDETLALQLQDELDREAERAQTVDLTDGGLFFCHLCNKNMTHMTPEGRTQHVNRCLDESEPPPLLLSSAVPDCPICGKKFKSSKSHSAHLKRCSMDMSVSPAVLLQALHRQAEERQNALSANTHTETVCTKRKGLTRTGVPAKKPRKKAEVLDEKTRVALTLSSSLYEQERESERELQLQLAASRVCVIPALKHVSGKGRGKKKKGAVPRPPPLLLVQDVEAAQNRRQERAAALLLCNRPPSPPTPTRCSSSLPGWGGAAPLWQKSSLLEEDSTHQSDLYTHELRRFFTLSEAATNDPVPSSIIRSASSDCPAIEVVTTKKSILPPSQTAAASMATEELPVSTQVFRDLMELAEDCMVPSQSSHSASCCDRDVLNSSLLPSGFVQEESEDQADRCTSGFPPKRTHTNSTANQTRRLSGQLGAHTESESHRSVAFSCLRLDLGSMVNNPQLSDVQLQVDSGEVYFAHSFMLYARCPLLAEMVHESGFGVQEEGMPAAQRILISDVPGKAVFALLQYLYTAHLSIPLSLRLYVLELASRFDLKQLEQLCELTQQQAANQGHDEDTANRENADGQKDRAFSDVLRSMWNEEDEDNEAVDGDQGHDKEEAAGEDNELTAGDGEICEEKVNEEELEEIYEFAATQRKKDEESGSVPEQEQSDTGEKEFTQLTEAKKSTCQDFKVTNANLVLGLDASLDRSYSSLFSDSLGDCEEGDLLSPSRSRKLSPKPPGRTLLQSSASVVDDLSLGFPRTSSYLPVPGESPDQQRDCEPEERFILKHKSQGPCSSSINLSPDKQQRKKEPEIIVLSDSSSPSPDSPLPHKKPEDYTRIRPYPPKSQKESKELKSIQCSPDCPTAAADQSPLDCSPELSWLIPSTPPQHSKSTSSSSTQTRSSICKVQLFPKTSAPFFSSPDSTVKNSVRVSRSPTRAFTAICSVEGEVLEVNPERLAPHSSTPLHPDIHQHPVPLDSSLRHCSFERLISGRTEEKPSDRTERAGFHISPLSDSPASSSHNGFRTSQRHRDHPHQSQHVAEVGTGVSLEGGARRSGIMEKGEGETEDTFDEKQCEGAALSGCRQSFMEMDEPPIAFNDSWGLDVCTDANPGCFSLRLEDSGECSQQGRPEERQDAAKPGSKGRLTPPSHHAWSSPSQAHRSPPATNIQAQTGPSPQGSTGRSPPQLSTNLLDSNVWDSWEEEEDDVLPLSQRVNPAARLRTPVSCQKRRRTLVPITPMPHYSDMDTPELKNKLNRFGVRPLPKRQMIIKLKEIHHYTHQLASSESEDEARHVSRPARAKLSSVAAGNRQPSCTQTLKFKEPSVPPSTSPQKHSRENQAELLSASQGSNTSTAASEESERSNPELAPSSDGDSDSDSGISASQATSRLQDRLQAVRAFILSDSELYTQILEYRPLILSQFHGRLKAVGIRLGISKLADYLDSQCITFTTAKPGQPSARCRRGKRTGKKPQSAGESGPSRKKEFRPQVKD